MSGLTIGNWIAIGALIVATIGALSTTANYLTGRRERRSKAQNRPRIKATINSRYYEGGWRSVQLHVIPLDEEQLDFRHESWRIERVQLLRPKGAILARAKDDDYASGTFYPEHPVRVVEGRAEGRPQRFALEFFIKLQGEERKQEPIFKVTFAHSKTGKRSKAIIPARIPANLELPEESEGPS